MADNGDITGEWVEIAEEGKDGQIIFYRQGPDVPPARGGRRQLHLKHQGQAGAEAPGPTDKSESVGTGGWSRDGDTLHIRVPGWEGDYEIEDVQDTRLILHKR